MRLIDAEGLLERFKWYEEMPANPYPWDFVGIENVIEEVPTIEVHRWIPVTERLPNSLANKALVALDSGLVGFGHYEGPYYGWYDLEVDEPFSVWGVEVTHWMPLPEAPKDGDSE